MSIMTLYVRGASKKAINERLAEGQKVYGTNHSMFGGGGDYVLDSSLEDGTVIKVYSSFAGGSPYAKAYGSWNSAKCRIR